MKKDDALFRQQVLDEIRSKLHGEILLRSGFPNSVLLLVLIAWLLLAILLNNFITIEPVHKFSGRFALSPEGKLEAILSVPYSFASDIYSGQIIPVKIIGVQQEMHVPIKIIDIDNKLYVASDFQGESVSLKVRALAVDTKVNDGGREFYLSEGILFSFGLKGKKTKILPWIINHYFGIEPSANKY